MAVEYSCPNCGFSYKVHATGDAGEPCPNCGLKQTDSAD